MVPNPDAQRRANLRAALAAFLVKADAPELQLRHRWLDSWEGVGVITMGVERQGFRLSLSHITEGEWRAVFMGDPMISLTQETPACSASEITSLEIERFRDSLLPRKSKATANRYRDLLSATFKRAIRDGYVAVNPGPNK